MTQIALPQPEELKCDMYVMLTDVQAVYTNWGQPGARAIRRASPEGLRALPFAAGSMGPKVAAACVFVRRMGGRAVIGSLADALSLLRGDASTTIMRENVDIEWAETGSGKGGKDQL